MRPSGEASRAVQAEKSLVVSAWGAVASRAGRGAGRERALPWLLLLLAITGAVLCCDSAYTQSASLFTPTDNTDTAGCWKTT